MKKILIFSLLCPFAVNAQISMQKTDEGILVSENGKNVLFYQIEPKNHNGEYERNNYIHPLWGVDGAVLTEDFPADHLHHRGIFRAWHQVWIDGQRIGDPWEIKDFEQEIVNTAFSNKKAAGILKTEVQWKSEKWKKQGEKVPYLRENTIITIHPEKENYRKIDFETRLLALEENLKIGGSEDEKGYSGFSVRMVLPDDVKFTGPDSQVTPEVSAVKSDGYINISGSVGKNNSHGGIVIADYPENPGYPQSWILRAKRSMQNAAWPGREPAEISTQNPLVLKYSLVIYSGKMDDRKIKNLL
jgi:hypothetical protein